jgi:hypothetical protein
MIIAIRKKDLSNKALLGEQLHEYWKMLHCFVEKLFQQQQNFILQMLFFFYIFRNHN